MVPQVSTMHIHMMLVGEKISDKHRGGEYSVFACICNLLILLISINHLTSRYLNIYVGMPDVEESFNVTRPVSPHEVILLTF